MSRLADYFAVVGYDYKKEGNGQSCGEVLQRFPEKDWDDCPFTDGVEKFCQPCGWQLSPQGRPPTFFVSVLTNVEADRYYCACLTFDEDVARPNLKAEEDDPDERFTTLVRSTKMFAPKCLLLISRLELFETFKNCLGLIYTVYVENMNTELETLIGNILGGVQVPLCGGPQIRFSIGAGDRQAVQSPLSATLPISRASVTMLVRQLGVANTVSVFCAALCDHKILFHSQSFSRLTDASQALTVLMYPLTYSYVYVPILPMELLEVLNTPTPFIAGVHTSLLPQLPNLLDVIMVDLDGGSIIIPENIKLFVMPEPMHSRLLKSLYLILQPELNSSDYAYPPSPVKSSSAEMVDKEIRAIFLRFFAELFFGYRSCLTVIRIHPEPFISFYKARFLGERGLVDDEFTRRLLDSMSFSKFVTERGPPYRVCDLFDEVFATMQDVLDNEEAHPERLQHDIHDLASLLYLNENPNPQPYAQKIPQPTEGAYSRIHLIPFPHLDGDKVQMILEEGLMKHMVKSKSSQTRLPQPRIVPSGPTIMSSFYRGHSGISNSRQLEVLHHCVVAIFENQITEAKKVFPAVLRSLKNKSMRQALVDELAVYIQGPQAVLEQQQFDMIVRLMNSSLQNESQLDENGLAAQMLPLATTFCRKLSPGVIQFAYTCMQEHAVWASSQFWEATFYRDVQQQIRQLYAPRYEENLFAQNSQAASIFAHLRNFRTNWQDARRQSIASTLRSTELSALDIAAEQMRTWNNLSSEEQRIIINNEESTVYSQAIHYTYRMIYMRVPLDVTRALKEVAMGLEGESLSNVTNSVTESDSVDAGTASEEPDAGETGANVVKFVTRFMDKVCSDSYVSADHLKALHQMIPGVVAMHIESLEAVHLETKRLPPIQKIKIITPILLPSEELIFGTGLRAYLLPDGREEGTTTGQSGPALLPAEGAIFLTNYRVIFRGTPADHMISARPVCRAFPISSLLKEKKITMTQIPQLDLRSHDALQLRSSTFQLLKIIFDEEVSSDEIEMLRKHIIRLRYPVSIMTSFAFTGHAILPGAQNVKVKEKNATLKGFAKKTLMKTARKAGFIPKDASRKHKYLAGTPPINRKNNADSYYGDRSLNTTDVDQMSVVSEEDYSLLIQTDARNIDRLAERAYSRDFTRLGLGSLYVNASSKLKVDTFRLTSINSSYTVCASYPSLLVVPQSVSDEGLMKIAKSHRQNRFPIITWRHPITKALLIRGSSFHGRGVMGMLKGHQHQSSAGKETVSSFRNNLSKQSLGNVEAGTTTSVEQEKYFAALVSATPFGNPQSVVNGTDGSETFSDSLSSLDSLGVVDALALCETPMLNRRNPLMRSLAGLRSTYPGRPKSAVSRTQETNHLIIPSAKQNGTMESSMHVDLPSSMGLQRASLYVLGEKTQVKSIKIEAFPRCDFIPVEYQDIRQIRNSFKKFMQACLPSVPFVEPERGMLRAIEESDWLAQIQRIMQVASAIVDLLDVQGSSVMICLEEGWDFTTQVVSVAQILLDPYYRTLEGFRILVEKEWLSFGHRFSHRSSQTSANQTTPFTPVFLQFLDAIYQIHSQFPLSFEFSQFYLEFLAYHHVSNRFRTFMLDCEWDRVEAGWFYEESIQQQRQQFQRDGSGDMDSPQAPKFSSGLSIWEYIDRYHTTSSVFYNFMYLPGNDSASVLRPSSDIFCLKLWPYYLNEYLATGPSYDFELVAKDMTEKDVTDSQDLSRDNSKQQVVSSSYDDPSITDSNGFAAIIQEIMKLEAELDRESGSWHSVWEDVERSSRDTTLQRQVSPSNQQMVMQGRTLHKRSTLEFIMRGRILGDAAQMFSQPHHFEKFTYTTPAYCDYCSHVLWGLQQSGLRCSDCGYNCHEKCMAHAPKNCTRVRTMSEVQLNREQALSDANISDTASFSGASTLPSSYSSSRAPRPASLADAHQLFSDCSRIVPEHRTHEGYLFKRGALLKGWKQRWFVLDSVKHQLRYYDSQDDPNCKGYVDLAEVASVTLIKNVIGGVPKKADDNVAFELKTTKRMYQFVANDAASAQEWMDRIQSCIQ